MERPVTLAGSACHQDLLDVSRGPPGPLLPPCTRCLRLVLLYWIILPRRPLQLPAQLSVFWASVDKVTLTQALPHVTLGA